MLGQHPLVATSRGSNERKDPSQGDTTKMFIHNLFRETDEARIVDFIREHPFAADHLNVIYYESARRTQLLEYLLRVAANLTGYCSVSVHDALARACRPR